MLTSRVEAFAQKIIDGERELERLRAELDTAAGELFDEILGRVDDGRAVSILILRYVAIKTFAEISAAMKMPLRSVYKVHALGRDQFNSAQPVKT